MPSLRLTWISGPCSPILKMSVLLRRCKLRSPFRLIQSSGSAQKRFRLDYEHFTEHDGQRDPRVPAIHQPGFTPVGEWPGGGFTTIGMPKMTGPLGSKARVNDPDTLITKIQILLERMKRCKKGVHFDRHTHLYHDLELDSLDQVEFCIALEHEFKIEIPDWEAERIVTVGDAVDLIADHPHAL